MGNTHKHITETGSNHDHEEHNHDHSQEEELQSKYYEFQLINEQMKQLQQQGAALDEQMTELHVALQGLNDLEGSRDNSTILVPISQGIFAKAELKDRKNLIVSVGNNVMVGKDVTHTIAMINERVDAVNIYKSDINRNLAELMKRAKALEKELQKLLQGAKG